MSAVETRERELEAVRRDAESCTRCDLFRNATQTVFGEGRTSAALMLVGEQPGDVEDETGRPFVGPAGLLLREVLAEVGLDERRIYVTNAVKHFKWRPQGKRRIHDKPNWSEIRACDHWLRLELALVRPRLLMCLGATATQAVLGRDARVTALRGQILEAPDVEPEVVVTIHPSAVLRAGERRRAMRAQLTEDLAFARDALRRGR
jgi:DNA polymerase